MVKRPLTLREKPAPDDTAAPADAETPVAQGKPDAEPANRQKRRQELGRYWLQVDRQTKQSFGTVEEAETAGMAIKTRFTQLQVAIYDREESQNRILELPV